MSKNSVFLFTEGKSNDPFFYSEVCRTSELTNTIDFEVVPPSAFPNTTHGNSGEQALVAFYKFLNEKHQLMTEFKGKKTAVLFYFDKDVDDIFGNTIKSKHVVYTKYYDIENHIILESDLLLVCSAATSLPRTRLESLFRSSSSWREGAAERWKDWVMLCLLSLSLNAKCQHNYSIKTSPINKNKFNEVDETLRKKCLEEIKVATKLEDEDFFRQVERIKVLVDALYQNGQQDMIFKGKWYSSFLAFDIEAVINNKNDFSHDSLQQKIIACALSKLDYSKEWVNHFKRPFEEIVKQML